MSYFSLIKNVELFLDDKPSVFALRDKAKKALLQRGFPNKKTEEFMDYYFDEDDYIEESPYEEIEEEVEAE
jgi:hypothetical protein